MMALNWSNMIVVLTTLLLACSALATLASDTAPEQLHLSLAGSNELTGSPTGMRIAWFTEGPITNSTAEYSSDPTQLSFTSTATTRQYLSGHGYHHVAFLNCSQFIGSATTAIYYRVGSSYNNSFSKVFSFSLAKFSANATTVVSMFGDLGYEDSASRKKIIMEIESEQLQQPSAQRQLLEVKDWSATFTRNKIEEIKDKIDMVFHAGDIGYADDSFLISPFYMTYENVYNGYMNWFQNVSTQMPYMVCPGNHESECHSPACIINHKKYGLPLSNFTAFNHRWHMPSEESGGHKNSNMWYSFNFGTVHYVSLNTETDFPGAEEERTGDSHIGNFPAGSFGKKGEYMQWLENDLKVADQRRQSKSALGRPWIVAVGHRPYDDIVEAAKLFEKYRVDVYMAGHKHSYVRSDGGPYGNDTMYVVAGGAGCDEMKQGVEEFEGKGMPALHQVVATSKRYSSGVMTTNATHLKWELLDSVTGQVIDSFELSK